MHCDVFCWAKIARALNLRKFSAQLKSIWCRWAWIDGRASFEWRWGGMRQIIQRVNTGGSVEALLVFAQMIYSYQRDGSRLGTRRKLFSLGGLDLGSAQSPPDAFRARGTENSERSTCFRFGELYLLCSTERVPRLFQLLSSLNSHFRSCFSSINNGEWYLKKIKDEEPEKFTCWGWRREKCRFCGFLANIRVLRIFFHQKSIFASFWGVLSVFLCQTPRDFPLLSTSPVSWCALAAIKPENRYQKALE